MYIMYTPCYIANAVYHMLCTIPLFAIYHTSFCYIAYLDCYMTFENVMVTVTSDEPE